MKSNTIVNADCLESMKELHTNSVDLIVTDPPYGYSFMGKDWDKVVVHQDIWVECLRVLKEGAFAFVMSAPRQDVQMAMIERISASGFNVGFTPIYWAYASGFPKASNIGKMVDKRGGVAVGWFGKWLREWRIKNNITQKEISKLFLSKTGGLTGCVANWELGLNMPTAEQFTKICRTFDLPFDSIEEAEREVIEKRRVHRNSESWETESGMLAVGEQNFDITEPSTPQAKALDGSYSGFQPKPAVEIILVAMKPLSEKTYVEQALKNGKGITWLDDCRVPLENNERKIVATSSTGFNNNTYEIGTGREYTQQGRFPANLLVSDDVLDHCNEQQFGNIGDYDNQFSRYFSLDKWFINKLPKSVQKTFPFLITPKASSGEKNEGLDGLPTKKKLPFMQTHGGTSGVVSKGMERVDAKDNKNIHPTCKPIELMSYLITLGSRENDLILDPFVGSGTTCIAARILSRKFIGIEKNKEYHKIAVARIKEHLEQMKLQEII